MAAILGTALRTPGRFAKRIVLALGAGVGFSAAALTADGTIDKYSPPVLLVAPDAARNLDFTANVEVLGSLWLIGNTDATNTLTVRDSTTATVVALKPKEFGIFVYNGTAWKFLQAQVGTLAATMLSTANTWSALQTFSSGLAGKFNAASMFVSTEQTGTGSAQNIAHGLSATPTRVLVVPTSGGAFTITEGTHTSTNVVVTMSNTVKYKVYAAL